MTFSLTITARQLALLPGTRTVDTIINVE